MSVADAYLSQESKQSKYSVTSLTNEDLGKYTVTTTSGSRYILDLDARTMVRHHDDESDWHGDLRRGNTKHGIINLAKCTVGSGMTIIIDQVVPGVKEEVGARFTTSVVSIIKDH